MNCQKIELRHCSYSQQAVLCSLSSIFDVIADKVAFVFGLSLLSVECYAMDHFLGCGYYMANGQTKSRTIFNAM